MAKKHHQTNPDSGKGDKEAPGFKNFFLQGGERVTHTPGVGRDTKTPLKRGDVVIEYKEGGVFNERRCEVYQNGVLVDIQYPRGRTEY